MSEKVLILVPYDTARGGITNFYQTLRDHLPPSIIYHYRGSRNFPFRKGFIKEAIRIFVDIIGFVLLLLKKDITIVQTTTSLNPKAVKRDGIFLIIAKFFKRKCTALCSSIPGGVSYITRCR